VARYIKPSQTEPYLKTTRAKVHLDALRNVLDTFRKSEPCTVFPKENIKRGRYEIRIKIADTPNDIPLILGDLLYCLRSSLDQTVWWLAKLRSRYPEGTQFPILDKKPNAKTRKIFAVLHTAGVPAGAIGEIKSLQPYHRANPASHLLWRLNLLCNIDKHRRIPIHGDVVDFNFLPMPDSVRQSVVVDHDQQMVRVPLEFKSQVALDPEASFNVVFGDTSEGISCDFDGVVDIYNFVADDVLARFARFFS
jgi:hypothetical protein